MFFKRKKEEAPAPQVNGAQTPRPVPKQEIETIDPEVPAEKELPPVPTEAKVPTIENEIFEEQELLGDDYNNSKLDNDLENIDNFDLKQQTFEEPLSPEEQALREQELAIQMKREELKIRKAREEEARMQAAQQNSSNQEVNNQDPLVQIQQALLNLDARVKEIEAILFRLLQATK